MLVTVFIYFAAGLIYAVAALLLIIAGTAAWIAVTWIAHTRAGFYYTGRANDDKPDWAKCAARMRAERPRRRYTAVRALIAPPSRKSPAPV